MLGLLAACCAALGVSCATPATAASNNVRISQLSDVAFGLITDASADASSSQSLCVYSNSGTDGYNVRAIGSGGGGAFTLASGSSSLAYDVQWSSAPGQSAGTALSPNVALTGQVSGARQQTCNSGPSSSASLIVIIRSSALASAEAGSYGGSLTLVIGPQ
jgi:hypothetical protein